MPKVIKKISENISSNTLFHFTSKLDYLINILTTTFKPRYCLEDLSNFTSANSPLEMAIPMVCFCDIPLSKIKVHLSKYGNYGIGLTKKWGISNGLSPLLYSEKDSKTAKLISQIFLELLKTKRGTHKTIDIGQISILELISYAKPYQGKMLRDGKYIDKIRFYDEREWRFVPDVNSKKLEAFIPKEIFLDLKEKEKYNSILHDNFTLHFTPDDIKYIVLKSEKEIDAFIQDLERIKSPIFNQRTVKKLTTRIITREQILYDF